MVRTHKECLIYGEIKNYSQRWGVGITIHRLSRFTRLLSTNIFFCDHGRLGIIIIIKFVTMVHEDGELQHITCYKTTYIGMWNGTYVSINTSSRIILYRHLVCVRARASDTCTNFNIWRNKENYLQ